MPTTPHEWPEPGTGTKAERALSAENLNTLTDAILELQAIPPGSGAPTDAKYIVQEAHAGLSAEQSLGALTTGLLLNTVTAGVGVLTTAVPGTHYVLPSGNVASASVAASLVHEGVDAYEGYTLESLYNGLDVTDLDLSLPGVGTMRYTGAGGWVFGSTSGANGLEVLGPVEAPTFNGDNFYGAFNGDVTGNLKHGGTPSSDHAGRGETMPFVAAEAQVFGDVVRIASTGKATKAQADSSANAPALALCLSASVDADATGTYLLLGIARDDTWNWTVGGLVYLSAATAGALTQTAPSASGNVVQVVGVALSADVIRFAPQLVVVEVA